MTTSFPDHFSAAAARYRQFRPAYPSALYDRLAALAPRRELCWDVATGSGQAACALAARFERVVATDASAEQIAHAAAAPRVEYRVEPAERSGLAAGSVDLITVAAALHWFDLDSFYREVRRVAGPGALLAAWSYAADLECTPAIDRVLARFRDQALAGCWPERFDYVRQGYATLPFPFDQITMPPLAITVDWSLDQLLGAVGTWSAVTRYRQSHGVDPTVALGEALREPWGPVTTRPVRIPLFFRVGRIAGALADRRDPP